MCKKIHKVRVTMLNYYNSHLIKFSAFFIILEIYGVQPMVVLVKSIVASLKYTPNANNQYLKSLIKTKIRV